MPDMARSPAGRRCRRPGGRRMRRSQKAASTREAEPSLEPHHRRALEEVQQCAEEAERRDRHGDGVERPHASAPRYLIRHEPQGERRQQPDQAVWQPGNDQPREISGRSAQGDSQQIRRLHVPRRQGLIERPGFIP